ASPAVADRRRGHTSGTRQTRRLPPGAGLDASRTRSPTSANAHTREPQPGGQSPADQENFGSGGRETSTAPKASVRQSHCYSTLLVSSSNLFTISLAPIPSA